MKITRFLAVAFFAVVLPQAAHAQTALQYFPLTPCRVVDTRSPDGVNGGPKLEAGISRVFAIRGYCGVPTTAKAVSVNVAIVGFGVPTGTPLPAKSWLTIWPSNQPQPGVSALNFDTNDWALANGGIYALGTAAQDLSVLNANIGNVHVIIDVSGYFQ